MIGMTATDRGLVDTNVVIYAADPSDEAKRRVAIQLIETLRSRNALVVSVQVLNEFYQRSTRTHKPPALSHAEALEIVADLSRAAEVLPLTASITLRALDAIPRHGFSFWDSLIWAAARENGIGVVYTEDYQHGRDVEGVRIINPFAEA